MLDGAYFPSELYETLSPEHFRNAVIGWSAVHLHLSVAWSLPICLFVIVALSIRDILQLLNKAIKISKTKHQQWKIQNSTQLVLRYQRILHLIQSTSDTFGPLLLNGFVLDMIRTCINTFMFLFICTTTDHKLQLFAWGAFSLIILSYLSKISADLNNEVRIMDIDRWLL